MNDNKQLHNQILSVLEGQMKFGGTVQIDTDDEPNFFTITQKWSFGDKDFIRTSTVKLEVYETKTEEVKI